MKKPNTKELIGLPLSVVRHAASMLNLQFGDITREGNKSWGQLALHIQAPWRLIDGTKLLIGKDDRWNPIGEVEEWDQWYEDPHPSREDQFWEEFIGGIDHVTKSFEGKSPRVCVRSVQENEIGDLDIVFSNGYHLQVYGCGTDDEFWRLLDPGCETDHYVVGTEKHARE